MVYSNPQTLLEPDWQYTEGVVNAGFSYGPQRYTTGLPTAPSSGVQVRPGNPTQNQIAVAASSFGYRTTDKVFTIWASTLANGGTRIEPVEHDRLIVSDVTWIMRSVKTTMYGAQFLVYCQRSQETALTEMYLIDDAGNSLIDDDGNLIVAG